MLTPSSNTVLEPMTAAILSDLRQVSAHYSRLRVIEISTRSRAVAQFDPQPMLDAASLLADARPHGIVWNGTSGGWTGFSSDRALVDELEKRFSIPASTVTLALAALLRSLGMQKIGFVTPYASDIQTRIIATFEAEGFACTASPCLGISENFAFAEVTEAQMDRLVEEAAAARPDVIIPYCTNLPAARHAVRWEAAYGIPVFDSVAIAARAGLELCGMQSNLVEGWGRVFEL